jgi:hypothetical protein
MRSIKLISILLFLKFLLPFSAYSQPTSAYLINGHKYDMEEDLFFRSVQEWYDASLNSIGLEKLVDTLAQAYGITITEFSFPDDVDLKYIEDSTGTYDIAGSISMAAWDLKANGLGCNFVALVSEMGISFKANSEFINGELLITHTQTEIAEPLVEVSGTGIFLCPLIADSLKFYLVSALREFLQNTAQAFAEGSSGGLFDLLSPVNAFKLNDPDLIAQALAGFPIYMKIYSASDPLSSSVQLITAVDFLTGTSSDRDAFKDIEPEYPDNPVLSYGGFSFLYWVLQRAFPWHTDWSETERVNAAFQIMEEKGIRDFRLEIRWRDLQKKAYLGEDLDPDSLDPGEIDPLLEDITHWDTSVFNNINYILTAGASHDLKAFMAIGVGYQERMPEDGSGNLIAPASPDWIPTQNMIAVSADEYLYNLKIYAHAVVRKFAAVIDIWQIENELNAAGFAAADPQWWRKGDLWQNQEFRNRVWEILVEAVRTEDPGAKITHDLHLLGFMPALEAWLKDMDIVGVNFYPNQTSALPEMGFVVGEYIWAVRRALKALGYPEKPVWLMETGYPGIEQTDVSDSLLLSEDMLYFSEKRQAAYIASAINSAAENGADGFFYYSLTTQEDIPDESADLNQYMRFSGLLRGESDESKPGLDIFTAQLRKFVDNISSDPDREKIPDLFILRQNYPNPFNPVTRIEFRIPHAQFVTLKIYNLLGKEVTTLVSKKLNPGNYTYHFDGKHLASGVYYCRLSAGEYRESKKMILLR